MTVLFIGALPEPTTGQSLACQVFLDSLKREHEVRVINLSKATFAQGVNSLSRILEVLRIIWRTARHARAADVIYLTVSESFAGNLKDVALYLACGRKLPHMAVHLHGGAALRRIMLGGGWQRRLNEFFVGKLGAAIVLGRRHVDVFAEALPAEKIHIVPNFAQDDLFAADKAIDTKFACTAPLRLLFLSNLLPGKGHVELLDAIEALDDRDRDAIVVDVAGGFETTDHEKDFRARIASIPQIRYHGIVRGEAKRALFHGAHLFCLPTYYPYEGQPISILEAYASGCAVITTDHSGIPDVFTPETNGFAVVPRSVASLRAQLARAIRSPECLRDIALGNARAARSQYRAAAHTARLQAIVESLARDAAPRRGR